LKQRNEKEEKSMYFLMLAALLGYSSVIISGGTTRSRDWVAELDLEG
jgi:hypothetical protein